MWKRVLYINKQQLLFCLGIEGNRTYVCTLYLLEKKNWQFMFENIVWRNWQS